MRSVFYFLFVALLCFSNALSAQKFYSRFSVGYAMALPFGDELIVDGYPMTGTGHTYPVNEKYSISNASLNTGFMGSIKAGYHINGGVSAEVGIVGALSAKKNTYQTENRLHTKMTIYAKMPVMVNPAIAYSSSRTRRSFYGSVGLCMPVSKKIYTETQSISRDKIMFYDKTEMTTKFSLGFTANIGYQVPISKVVYLFSELSFLNISFLTKQSNLLESDVNGKSQMDSRSTSQKQVNYERGQDVTSTIYDPNQPMTIPAYRIPFSNFGFNFGFGVNY